MTPGNEPLPDLGELLATDLNGYFSQLMLNYQQRLYSFALRQSGSPQDAEDIVQEAFIRAYHALADYPPERIRMMKLQPWLYKITLNIFYRQKGNARLQSISLDLSEESSHLEIEDDERVQPEQLWEDKEALLELEEMIARLPEQYRIAISCYYFDEFSYREIADLLNLPIGTIKSHVHRGMLLLRRSAEKRSNPIM
ncbi:MAG TPA: RNA polymerase sigma factor [Ktedonobacteraceae bacterium]|nr:RNA polymerase sigma factor [Ktedonobacteraceae bacterium]